MRRVLWVEIAAATAFWGAVSLLYTLQIWWLSQEVPGRQQILSGIIWTGSFYLFWIPLTVIVWTVTRLWTPGHLGWPRYVGQHLLLGIAAAAVHNAITTWGAMWIFAPPGEEFFDLFLGAMRGRSYTELIIYGGVVASGQAMWLYDRWRDRDAQAARLEAQLSQARLSALEAQVQPHFLFNSLHTIASLARDGRNADVVRLIADLSDLLRAVTDRPSSTRVLADEVEFARRYLDIQKARFEDRLRVVIDASEEAGAIVVPTLTLQPLVDNAVRHGISNSVRGGTITIRAGLTDGSLVLEVEDDGAGPPDGWSRATTAGTGLSNLESRLHILYGGLARLDAGPVGTGGFIAAVSLPVT